MVGAAVLFCVFIFGRKNFSNNAPIRPAMLPVKIYYYSSELDKDAAGNVLCSRNGLVPLEKQMPATDTPIQDAIRLLISGSRSENEKNAGVETEFPLAGFALKSADLQNGVLTLEFDDPQNRTGGGACRAGIMWFQIEATAKQFEGVRQVRFVPETLFQP